MHTDLRFCASLASSGRFEMFRGEKRGCCVRSRAASRSKNQSDGQVEPSHRCSAYLCMERDGQVVGYPVGGRVPGGRWVVGLVWSPRLALPPPACLPAVPAARLPCTAVVVGAPHECAVAECVLPLSCPVPGGRADTVRWCGGAVVSSPCACWARSVGRRGVWWCVADGGAGTTVRSCPRIGLRPSFAPRPVP